MSGRVISLTATTVALTALLAAGSNPVTTHAGPSSHVPPAGATVLPSGRLVTPAGHQYNLGDFPVGLAISPDGRMAVAPGNGQGKGFNDGFGSLCQDPGKPNECGYVPAANQGNPLTPSPDESLYVTDLVGGGVSRVVATPTSHDPSHPNFNFFAMGVVFSPDGSHLYATGGGNDALYDFTVAYPTLTSPPKTTYLQTINGTATSSPTYVQPSNGIAGETKGLAITPDGQTLVVLKEQLDAVDLVKASDLSLIQEIQFPGMQTADTGIGAAIGFGYPYAVAVSPDGTKAYVSMQGVGLVDIINMPAGAVPATLSPLHIAVGDHPTGLTLSSDGSFLMVANANDDTVSIVTLSPAPSVAQTLAVHALDNKPVGSVPNAVALAPGNTRAYVALAGDNAVAVLDLVSGTWGVSGFVPTGWYADAVGVRSQTGQLLAVAAKGLGSRYIAGGEYPVPSLGGPAALPAPYYYDGSNMPGLLSVIDAPGTAASLAPMTQQVRDDIAFAGSADAPTPSNPIPAHDGGSSPITHVLYVIRENRTFDQVFGDLGATRPDVNADPNLQTLASATPNAHAIAQQYAISDNFFSDGEASVQGHYWTSSANSNDYTEKSWRQYYSPRNHPGDSVSTVSEPRGCSLFQAAQLKSVATSGAFTYYDDGEPVGVSNPSIDVTSAIAGLLPPGTPVTPTTHQPASQCAPVPATSIDPTFHNDQVGFSTDNRPLADAFLCSSGLNSDGTPITTPSSSCPQGPTGFLRNLTYMTLPGDHTTGFGGVNTPRAEVARNDAALGTIISALSRSKYWSSTAVFVVEDDSQDGPDHVDGHRNILLVASPYAKHLSADACNGGYIGHVQYDQAGVIRTIGLILGLPPLSAYDSTAAPLYDLFQDKNQASQLTTDDLRPYNTAPSPAFIDETVASLPHTATTTALRIESQHMDFSGIDLAGPGLEDVLWRSVRSDPIPQQLAVELDAARVTATQASDAGGDGATPAHLLSVNSALSRVWQPSRIVAAAATCLPSAVAETPYASLLAGAAGAAVLVTLGVREIGSRRRRRDGARLSS